MRRSLFPIAVSLLAVPAIVAAETVVQGIGQGKDGDSLLVGETEVRLFGIDAPELGQTCKRTGESWECGAAAADALSRLVTGKMVKCWSAGTDDYQRTLGRCIAGAVDINKAMVANGHAVAFRRYSTDYAAAENAAKAAKLGLWAGEFQRPDEYRQGAIRRSNATTQPRVRSTSRAKSSDWVGRAQSNCNIKGNRNRRGQWIYHMPGMPYYDQTRPEEIFCSESEAVAAGYRRAIVR